MMGRDLVSKFLAAGLSAGVFLIWWPEHHATSGLTSLVVRGALWTLSFELLLLAFAPLERLVRRAAVARLREPRLPDLLAGVPARARVGGACALACVGAAVPATLLARTDVPRARPAAPRAQRVVVVKRRVIRQRVVVERFVPARPVAAQPARVVVARAAEPRRAVVKRAPAKAKPAPAAKAPVAKQPAIPTPSATAPTPTTEAAPAAPAPAAAAG